MGGRMIVKAALKMRNFVVFAVILIISYVTGYLPFVLVGLGIYICFVVQTLKDEGFRKECLEKDKLLQIRKLDSECHQQYCEVCERINKSGRQKIQRVLREKDEIVRLFYKNDIDPLKLKIIEQILNLVIAYIKLVYFYGIKLEELTTFQVNEILDRVNLKKTKLRCAKDAGMDEKLAERVKEWKSELVKTRSRLSYIESAIRTFKHQMIVSDDKYETLADIEGIINEATALDNVLRARKDRLNLHT